MTPLAHRIVRQLCFPVSKRPENFDTDFANDILRCQVFEVSAAVQMLDRLDTNENSDLPADTSLATFLPAEQTWLEFEVSEFGRVGLLASGKSPFKIHCAVSNDGWIETFREGEVPRHCATILPALLTVVNSPQTFGRKQHQPHAGLQRKLAAKLKLVGKFPLHAWTEIIINAGPPKDLSGDGVHLGILSGRKPLHFVRAHLRELPDRQVVVCGHWRGDPSIGIKRSRYVITDPELAH